MNWCLFLFRQSRRHLQATNYSYSQPILPLIGPFLVPSHGNSFFSVKHNKHAVLFRFRWLVVSWATDLYVYCVHVMYKTKMEHDNTDTNMKRRSRQWHKEETCKCSTISGPDVFLCALISAQFQAISEVLRIIHVAMCSLVSSSHKITYFNEPNDFPIGWRYTPVLSFTKYRNLANSICTCWYEAA